MADSSGTVLITGGSSGIGLASARLFARHGWQVILAARGEAALARAAATIPGSRYHVADVADPDSVEELFRAAGPVDVVVHAATVMAYGRLDELDPTVFRTVTRTAIEGTFSVARAALAGFRRQHKGTLVVVNSLVGQIASPYLGAYATAKWGQAGLLRTLQLELRSEPDIHVCSIAPGGVNTPIYAQAANVTGRRPRPPLPVDQPEKVAEAIFGCVSRPRPRVSVGLANHVIRFGFVALPAVYDALVGPLLNRLSLLDQPAAHSTGNVLAPKPDGEAEADHWVRRWSISDRH